MNRRDVLMTTILSVLTWPVFAGADAGREAAAPAGNLDQSGAAALVRVHSSPTCGCCEKWVDHMRESGFQVEIDDTDALAPIKERLGVPYGLGSCHTAEVDGYFIEGHVPAADVRRLLAERPAAKGLAVPGMPLGSPGMEAARSESYRVLLVDHDGQEHVFAEH